MTSQRIVLLGLRGAGKSTVGPRLAARLALPCFDTDRRVAEQLAEPAELVRRGAIPELRRAELAAVREFSRRPEGVLSLGGGTVEVPEVHALLAGWRAFLLDAPDTILAERIAADPAPRPPLVDASPIREIEILRHRRWSLYTRFRPAIIDTSTVAPDEVVETILARLSAAGSDAGSKADGGAGGAGA